MFGIETTLPEMTDGVGVPTGDGVGTGVEVDPPPGVPPEIGGIEPPVEPPPPPPPQAASAEANTVAPARIPRVFAIFTFSILPLSVPRSEHAVLNTMIPTIFFRVQ